MSPREVAQLTPDQTAFLLADAKRIKSIAGGISAIPASGLSSMADNDGLIKVRLSDGTLASIPAVRPEPPKEHEKPEPKKRRRRGRKRRG